MYTINNNNNDHYPNKTAALKQHGEVPGGQPLHLIDQEPLITMACHSTQHKDSYFALYEVHPCGVLMDLCWHCMVEGRDYTVSRSVKIHISTKVNSECLH